MNETNLEHQLIESDKLVLVKYYPKFDSEINYPSDIFNHEETLEKIKKCLFMSQINKSEAKLSGNIIDKSYLLSEISVGEKEHVSETIKFNPSKNNPFAPYLANIFDLHTHPINLTPSIIDLFGINSTHEEGVICFAEGSLQKSISHKNSEINPIYIIGRNINDKIELLCYQFEKENLPLPKTRFERNNAVRDIYCKIEPKLLSAQQMSELDAINKTLDFYVALMNSCEGITAFGKTI